MYSQYEEEKFIIEALKDVPPSHQRLLDIGAWDPKVFSNSRVLIEHGWSAVLIEPSPGPLRNLIAEYGESGRVTVMSCAVTVEGGFLELAVTDDAVTQPTSDTKRMAEWIHQGGYFGKLTVASISVADLCHRLGGEFEFVNIDAEGTSVDLFAEMLRIGPRPRCICVEHDSRFVELSQHAEAANYQMVHENGTNRVYRWMGKREW